jgi:hypothetical protein
MPIYRIANRNILFIHVPKTGGTSIEAYLELHAEAALHNQGRKLLRPYRQSLFAPALAMQHFHADLLQAMFPEAFFDYAFMVVRDPMARLLSEYGHSIGLNRLDSRLPFNVWARILLGLARIAPTLSNNHYRPQSEFKCFDAEVFRFEDGIPAILKTLAERLSLPPPADVPHEKRSGVREIAVSPAIKALVRSRYSRDFESFGYPPP